MLVGVAPLDNLQAHATARQEPLAPTDKLSRVTAVGEDAAQPAKPFQKNCQNQLRALAILDGCRMDDDVQDQTQRINQEMSLASHNLLSRIIAAHSSVVRCLNALRIDDRSGRGFFFPLRSRTRSRRESWMVCHSPSRRQVMK